jgi:dTDP-4-amino-4,6-dideoxygalactose transaminase
MLSTYIPFHKAYITEEEINEVVDSLKSGWLTMGPKTLRFEEEFSRYIDSRHSIALNSGTAALHLALKAIDIKPGDEVILPTMTFTATGEVVCYFRGKPIIVDVEKDTHNISISEIEKAISPNTKAIIPVHYAGQPCDMDEIKHIADAYKLRVIEDAAHSLPAWYKRQSSEIRNQKSEKNDVWKKIGTICDMTCFSFYATKTLATGEGGMVTTENDEWAERIKVLRLHGITRDAWKRYSNDGSWFYEVVEAGHKYNMTDIQAALGLAQLKKLELMWEKRKAIADKYTEAFKDSDFIIIPHVKPDRISAWHLYVIKLNLDALRIDRAGFIEELELRGIGTSVHFIPLHKHPFYNNSFGYDSKDFPVAEWIYERIISLPIYPQMSDKEIEYVIGSVEDACKKFRR